MPNIKRAATSGLTKTGTAIPDVPDAPTVGAPSDVGTSRAYNNGAATVAITAAATGGTPSSYTVTSSPGNFTGSGTSPVTVTGLQSATSYTFTATGTNATATGPASAASAAVTATTVPQAPTIGTVSVTNSTTVSIPFTAGATGGKTISSYTTTSSPSISLSTSGTSSPLTATGSFAVGQAYTFTIAAVNANGTSTASAASNSLTINPGTFISYLSGAFSFEGLFANSTGIYVTGFTASAGTSSDVLTARYNLDGTLNWQRTLSVSSQKDRGRAIALDSSGNVYVGGEWYQGSTNTTSAFLAQYSSTGTLNYQKDLSMTNSNYDYIVDMAIDSSNNIYCVGGYRTSVGGSIFPATWKFTTTPTQTWAYRDTFNSTFETSFDDKVALDSSGNIYRLEKDFTGAKTSYPGFQVTRRQPGGTNGGGVGVAPSLGTSFGARALAVDSDANVYIGGFNEFASPQTSGINKYTFGTVGSPSLTKVWGRNISGIGLMNSLTTDSSGNIYGIREISGANTLSIIKWDSSGTIQWQRTMVITSNSIVGRKIFWNSSTNTIVICGRGANLPMLLSLPVDGSGTGTYTVGSYSYVYASSSYTSTNTTAPGALSSASTGTSITTTINNSTLTGATSSNTNNVTTI